MSSGDVVLVRFSFTDHSSAKQRPAVVIRSEAYHRTRPDILIMAITSQARQRPAIGEATIRRWKGAGLIKPSVFKPLLATVERSLIRRKLAVWRQKIYRICARCYQPFSVARNGTVVERARHFG